MKANKFFAVAMAAIALVACKPNGGNEPENELKLDQASINIEPEAEATLTATIACEFTVDNEKVVALTPANDGKSVKIKGLAVGTAIVTAKAGTATKTCVVKVAKQAGPTPTGKEIKASEIYPIVMDGVTYEANESKIVASFQPNDVDQFLYVWEQTYVGGEAQGMNSMGNTEGYTSLVVTAVGWSGMGYNLNEGCPAMDAVRALRDKMVANPDQYIFHMAIKSTDNAEHTCYFLNTEKTTFKLNNDPENGGFKRDGAWHEIEIPVEQFINDIATADLSKGCNIFCVLSGGVQGTVLNLDAVYFYKK